MKNPALAAVLALFVAVFAPLRSSAQDTDNAALLYWQAIYAANPLSTHQQGILRQKSSDPLDEAAAEEIIRFWRYSLDTVKRASEKPTCNWGLNFDGGPALRTMYLSRLQEFARALRLPARLRLQRGDIDGATDDLITMLRFSRHAGEPALVIAWSVQFVIRGFAMQAVVDNLPKFSDAALARLAETRMSSHNAPAPARPPARFRRSSCRRMNPLHRRNRRTKRSGPCCWRPSRRVSGTAGARRWRNRTTRTTTARPSRCARWMAGWNCAPG